MTGKPERPDYMNERRAIAYTPFGERVFRQLVQEKQIPFHKFGKRRFYLAADIDEALARRRMTWGDGDKSGSGDRPDPRPTITTSQSKVLDFAEAVRRTTSETRSPSPAD